MVDRSGGKITPIPDQRDQDGRPGAGQPGSAYSGYSVAYNMGQGSAGGYTPGITLGTPADWFGPLNPQAPSAPPEVMGRKFDFPSGYNLNIEPRAYKPIKFSDLRWLADGYDVLRTIIETRKDQVTRLNWNIKPREDAFGKKLMKPNDPLLSEIRDFFTMPDGEQFWDAWVRTLLEDLFVLDAPAVFCRRNRGGKLIGLDNIDGSSLKVIIDDWGRIPQPPIPAFQQNLKGLPALNYTTRDIIYRPRNMRSHDVYGYGPVEQIIMTINIALRREIFMLQYYTEGNVPEALIGAPDNWTPKQIVEFQNWWDGILAGETGTRRRARFVPGGMGKTFIDTKEKALTGETDEWLVRICCFAFSITPTPFIRQVNRATAESQKEQATEEGLAPIQQWLKSYINYIIRREWKTDKAEFSFEIPDDIDAEKQSTVLTNYVKAGIFSINMALDKLGEDPIDGGDQHLALLPTGWVPIAPTNQFGASGGAEGAGEVNDDVKARGTVKDGKEPPKDTSAPPNPAPVAKGPTTEVGKLAESPFGKANTPVVLVNVDRAPIRDKETQLNILIEDALDQAKRDTLPHIKASLHQLGKASLFDGPISSKIAQSLNFSALQNIAGKIGDILVSVAQNTVNYISGHFTISTDDLDTALKDAGDTAQNRGEELVSLDPGAEMSIMPTTINMIDEIIDDGIKRQLTPDEIVGSIEERVFDNSRAVMIANAETSRAVSYGTEAIASTMVSSGVTKGWITMGDDRVCSDICAQNELDGFIPMDYKFSSGHKMTPGHPRCRCSIMLSH
jgi:hypothetical protein